MIRIGETANRISPAIFGNSCRNGASQFAATASWPGIEPESGSSERTNNPKINTARMAPAEAIPTRPKLSSSADCVFRFRDATPTASANMKGTVKAPVVDPEASKAMANRSLVLK